MPTPGLTTDLNPSGTDFILHIERPCGGCFTDKPHGNSSNNGLSDTACVRTRVRFFSGSTASWRLVFAVIRTTCNSLLVLTKSILIPSNHLRANARVDNRVKSSRHVKSRRIRHRPLCVYNWGPRCARITLLTDEPTDGLTLIHTLPYRPPLAISQRPR